MSDDHITTYTKEGQLANKYTSRPRFGGVEHAAEPGVDALHPAWLARTDTVVRDLRAHSLDGLNQSTSGSGSVSQSGSVSAVLDTGTTSGSVARLNWFMDNFAVERSYDRPISAGFDLRMVDDTTDRVDHWTVGRVHAGEPGFGFRVDSGDLVGVAHDGTAETTTTLVTGVGQARDDWRLEFRPGERVEFYEGGVRLGEVTETLPNGENSSADFELRVANTAGVQRRIFHSEGWVVNHP